MELSKVYSIARSYRSYNEFKSAIDKEINDVPITVASSNEFELVVKNCLIADVVESLPSESKCCGRCIDGLDICIHETE